MSEGSMRYINGRLHYITLQDSVIKT